MVSEDISSCLQPNWDELAKVWNCFENRGTTLTMLDSLNDEISSPVLYIGGGIGTIPTELSHRGYSVAIMDRSKEMAKIALQRYGLEYVVSDVCDIDGPKFVQSYGTIICATGVLDTMNRQQKEETLWKLQAWLLPHGGLVSFSFYRSEGIQELSKIIPCLKFGTFLRNKVPLELWYNGNINQNKEILIGKELARYFALYKAVQTSLRVSKTGTYQFLQRNLPDFDILVEPENEIRNLKRKGFDPVTSTCFPDANTIMFYGRKKCFKKY